ncbi:MAG: helix-turn-helix transcriptional regulator [Myxococcaceae bacterium]
MGANVRRARQQAGLTQAQLAEAAHVTDETVSRLERGAYEPSLSTVVAVAEALNTNVDILVRGGELRPSRRASPASARLRRKFEQLTNRRLRGTFVMSTAAAAVIAAQTSS